MSRLSIYGTPWIDLIFENKNQEYGAYQLRRDSVKSSLTALFMGLLFVASIGGITSIVSHFNRGIAPTIPIPEWSIPIQVSEIVHPIVEEPILPEVKSQVSEATIENDQLINPVIVHPEDANQNIAPNVENNIATPDSSEGTGTIGINPTTSGTGTEIPKAVDYGNKVVNSTELDKMPEFPGGINKFYNYIGNNFEKPEIDAITTFRVFVSFVIEKDGSMTDIKAIKDPGFGLGKEAIRVLKSLKTKWSPGMKDAKAVRTAYTLPIVVDMQ
jgi:protein TonB